MYLQTSLAILAALSPFLVRAAPAVDKREADILNTFERRFADVSAKTLIPRSESAPSAQCNLASIQMPNSKLSIHILAILPL